ncbi:MAG: hypothetical protein ACYC6Y_18965, partial [Thermoguttaceae bacterium]
MSKRFNPYHAWLGIPAEEQPANHYRLLGIPLFEPNPDVIQNGLDQRMAHVKTFAMGPHAAESQQLLAELSQAGVCLLRPDKRQVYDHQLKSRLLAAAETAPVPPGAGLPPDTPAARISPAQVAPSRETPHAAAAPHVVAARQSPRW